MTIIYKYQSLINNIINTNKFSNLIWWFISENPNAIHFLKQNPNKIDWSYLSENPNAIPLLEQNIDKINWWALSVNPNLFEFDYLAMSKERTKIIEQELISKALHPYRINKWLDYHIENGGDICNFEF